METLQIKSIKIDDTNLCVFIDNKWISIGTFRK